MKLEELVELIRPDRTLLLLGAGASIPSGAPSGAQLARYLAERLAPAPDGDDLSEIAGIFEHRRGRRELATAVKDRLRNLQPTGGILALPTYEWKALYSTNFDKLVEHSYRKSGVDLDVVRSNYDFTYTTGRVSGQVLYKIHGCMDKDVGFGDQARMVLTEQDYDEVKSFRQALFISLQQAMMTSNTLVVGQSLRDAHLRDLAKEVASLRSQGTPGRVFLLVYDYDEDRARLLEQRGIEVIQGTLDKLIYQLQTAKVPSLAHAAISSPATPGTTLPAALAPTTVDVSHASTLAADPLRLYNGRPATYADIAAGLTIDRHCEPRLRQAQNSRRGYFLVITGSAGVGKTSVARRLLSSRHNEGFAAYEHLNDYPLDVDAWIDFEASLRHSNQQAVLLIDDCAQNLSALNRLVDALGAIDRPFLRLVVTANSAQWRLRAKSPYFFSRGTSERMSLLTDVDIRNLINLVDQNPQIRKLVDPRFLNLGREDKLRRLRERCSAEMYVCLKNIFHTEQLDEILLTEFADLDPDVQDIYRYVSAVQAMSGKVHRQLIMRLLSLDATALNNLLDRMADVVSEHDISDSKGLYGWTTRHDAIAEVIATVKFSDQDELSYLLERLIDGLNPTEYIEIQTARGIAGNDMGIPRLKDRAEQYRLLLKLIDVVPAERTPRRRLIRMYLDDDRLSEADRAVRTAKTALGKDGIVERYRAMLMYRRALNASGLMDEDRRALLLEAENVAHKCIEDWPHDRHNYRVLGDIGITLAEKFNQNEVLDDAIHLLVEAETRNPDPDFRRERRDLERRRQRLSPAKSPELGD